MKNELVLRAVATAALGAAACGTVDSGDRISAGGTTAAGGSSTGSVGSSSGTGLSSGSGGSMSGDGNDSFDEAQPITSRVSGTLSPTGDVDYYYFEGKKGEVVRAYITDAQTAHNAAFDPSWIDTVITLYDATRTQIAENNEPRPHRSNDA